MPTFNGSQQILARDHFQKRAEYHLKRLKELLSGIDQGVERQKLHVTSKLIKDELAMDRNLARRVSLSSKEKEAADAIEKARSCFHIKLTFDAVLLAEDGRAAVSELESWLSRRA
jgi:hypothetical protein